MVPRRVLLERLLEGFPTDRIRCSSGAVGVVSTHNGVRVELEDGSSAEGDLLIGADGLHSIVRDIVGALHAEPTGWCSWQGLVTLPDGPDKHVALMIIGEDGDLDLAVGPLPDRAAAADEARGDSRTGRNDAASATHP